MDYYAIGQRIRKFRKAQNLSQEALAEQANISTTHMSHIETGNTKLSLQVFADLAAALHVSADALLFDAPPSREARLCWREIAGRCSIQATPEQTQILTDIVRAAKRGHWTNISLNAFYETDLRQNTGFRTGRCGHRPLRRL